MAGNYGDTMGAICSGGGRTSLEWIIDGKPMVDTDGDGLPDSPEIVVTAEKVDLPGDYYAYLKNGEFIIMKDGWFTNTYQGTFKPGTAQNHDFVAKDSALELLVNLKVWKLKVALNQHLNAISGPLQKIDAQLARHKVEAVGDRSAPCERYDPNPVQ